MPETPRDAKACHRPEERVHGAGLRAKEIPSRIMSSSSLRDFVVRTWLDRMDQVGELDGILDEEYGNVVTDDICSC